MSPYQSTYLCLMCLFIVILLVSIMVLIINHFKEHKRFLCKMDNSIQDIGRFIDSYSHNFWSAASKLQNDVHAIHERIVTEPAKQIEPVDLPIWVAEPCPVCGHNPQIISDTDDRDAMVFCKHCDKFGYTAGGETVRGAVYMWNKTVTEYLEKAKAQEEPAAEKTCNADYCDI